MPLPTINLACSEEGAAILILRGIHRIEPIGNFSVKEMAKPFVMFERTNELTDILCGYERAYESAIKDKDTSDPNVLWRYVHDELIGDEDTGFEYEDKEDDRTFAEKYEDASR